MAHNTLTCSTCTPRTCLPMCSRMPKRTIPPRILLRRVMRLSRELFIWTMNEIRLPYGKCSVSLGIIYFRLWILLLPRSFVSSSIVTRQRSIWGLGLGILRGPMKSFMPMIRASMIMGLQQALARALFTNRHYFFLCYLQVCFPILLFSAVIWFSLLLSHYSLF